MPSSHKMIIDCKDGGWSVPTVLEPNSMWTIAPDPTTLYSIDGGRTHQDFHGGSIGHRVSGAPYIIPGYVWFAGLNVLVEHHRPGGTDAQILYFPPGTNLAAISVGPNGGTIQFVIIDAPGTYSDNTGTCSVEVIYTGDVPTTRPTSMPPPPVRKPPAPPVKRPPPPPPLYWWVEVDYDDGRSEWHAFLTQADAIDGVTFYGLQDSVTAVSQPYFAQHHP